jgi:hypothetical protein
MKTQVRIALAIIPVLCLSLLICGSGGASNGAPAITPAATPMATVNELDPSATYYFAVSAYNGREGDCSNEVSKVRPLTGAVSLAWDPVENQKVTVYYVHYGTTSPNKPGDCNYTKKMPVTIVP